MRGYATKMAEPGGQYRKVGQDATKIWFGACDFAIKKSRWMLFEKSKMKSAGLRKCVFI
jgi:hypothetical protein